MTTNTTRKFPLSHLIERLESNYSDTAQDLASRKAKFAEDPIYTMRFGDRLMESIARENVAAYVLRLLKETLSLDATVSTMTRESRTMARRLPSSTDHCSNA